MNVMSSRKCVIHSGMEKDPKLKVVCYSSCMIELNEYLDLLRGRKASEKIGEM